ncbi:MAG: GNAT family N-acetyltransferase [Methylocystaceae bacterium]|nr:GNAT family N-acetyltransferase [Methylocystaceae bacterium]
MIFQVISSDNPFWDQCFNILERNQKDVFYTSGFAQLCQKTINAQDKVQCAIWNDEQGNLLMYPFVLRNLCTFIDDPNVDGFYDTVSLYGRGGIVGQAEDVVFKLFYRELENYFSDKNVFCSFDRFHPVIGNHDLIPHQGKAMEIGGFVIADLQRDMDEINRSFKSSVRKDVKKAIRNGVEWFCENSIDHLDDFLAIYYKTMDRNNASDFHYFPEEYFRNLETLLKEDFLFFYARHEGTIVSCELVLLHGDYSHSFLGGTRHEALPLAANPLLKKAIIETTHKMGCRYYLLGGGHQAEDGIFKYKKAYAPEGVYPSFIGGTIWNNERYQKLKLELSEAGHQIISSRFQFYDI